MVAVEALDTAEVDVCGFVVELVFSIGLAFIFGLAFELGVVLLDVGLAVAFDATFDCEVEVTLELDAEVVDSDELVAGNVGSGRVLEGAEDVEAEPDAEGLAVERSDVE